MSEKPDVERSFETIGVHNGYCKKFQMNVGTLITTKLLKNFVIPVVKKYKKHYNNPGKLAMSVSELILEEDKLDAAQSIVRELEEKPVNFILKRF